jgi:hypothetical protein
VAQEFATRHRRREEHGIAGRWLLGLQPRQDLVYHRRSIYEACRRRCAPATGSEGRQRRHLQPRLRPEQASSGG